MLCVYVHMCMRAYAHTQGQIQISGYTWGREENWIKEEHWRL